MTYLTDSCNEDGAKKVEFQLTEDDREALASMAKDNGFLNTNGTGDIDMLLRAVARSFYLIVPNRIQDVNDYAFALSYEEWIEYCKYGEPGVIEMGVWCGNEFFPDIMREMNQGGSVEASMRQARDLQ